MASLIKLSTSSFWVARLRLWVVVPKHPRGGFWKQTMRSTKVPITKPKKIAQRVADEMERINRQAVEGTPTETIYSDMVASIMRATNIEPPVRATTWTKAVDDFLSSTDSGEKSIIQYRQQCEQFTRYLGVRSSHDLRSISGDDFIGFYRHLQSGGRSANTARNAAKTVRRVLERAHLLGFTSVNVGKLYKLRGGSTVQRHPFTQEDLRVIFDHIEKHEDDEWRVACLFGLYYGMRLGDAVSRSFSEISTENGMRVLRFIPQKKLRRRKEVVLPLVGDLIDLKGKSKITPRLATIYNPSKSFGLLLDRAGLKRKASKASGEGRSVANKTFHSFRHTINSLLVDAGVDARVRQLICDHEDARVAAGYTHASIKTMAKSIELAVKPNATLRRSKTVA